MKLKKIIAVLLTVCICAQISSAFSLKAKADGWSSTADGAAKYSDALTSLSNTMKKVQNGADLFNTISTIASVGSTIFSMYQGTVCILQMFGALEDPTERFQQTVLSKLNDIKAGIDNVNANIQVLANQNMSDHGALGVQIDASTIATLRGNLNSFMSSYEDPKDACYTEATMKVNIKLREWYESTSSADDLVILLPASTLTKREKKNGLDSSLFSVTKEMNEYTIPGSAITAARNNYVSSHPWNMRTAANDITEIFKTALDAEMRNDSTALAKWANERIPYTVKVKYESELPKNYAALNAEQRNKILDTCTAAAYEALNGTILTEFARSSTDNAYTLKVVNAFNSYAQALMRSPSPVELQYDIYKNSYVFQGDIEYVASDGEKRNLAMDVRDFYILELTEFALFAAGIADASGSWDSDKIMDKWAEAVCEITDDYLRFYKTENGVPADNYSYQLGKVVGYTTARVESSLTAESQSNVNYTNEVYKGFTKTDWTISVDKKSIMNSTGVSRILFRYDELKKNPNVKKMFVNNTDDFRSYMAYRTGKEIDENVLVSYEGTQQLSSTVDMCAWVVTGEYFSGYEKNQKKVPIFDEDRIDNGADSEDCLIKDCAVGTMFNLNNASLYSSRLGARAFYGESYWAWNRDESATFYEGDYSELRKFNSVKWNTTNTAYTTLHVFRDYGVFTLRDLVQTTEDLPPIRTGSTLSNGSIWIIAAVAVVAVAGVAALVVVKKKKKPTLASGENTDE